MRHSGTVVRLGPSGIPDPDLRPGSLPTLTTLSHRRFGTVGDLVAANDGVVNVYIGGSIMSMKAK